MRQNAERLRMLAQIQHRGRAIVDTAAHAAALNGQPLFNRHAQCAARRGIPHMAGKSVRLAETPCAAMQEHDAGARLDRVWTLKQEGNLRAVEGRKKIRSIGFCLSVCYKTGRGSARLLRPSVLFCKMRNYFIPAASRRSGQLVMLFSVTYSVI